MADLFAAGRAEVVDIGLPGSDIKCWPYFYREQEALQLFDQLNSKLEWRPEQLRIYGRRIEAPRLTAWYGDTDKDYYYSGLVHTSISMPPLLDQIRQNLLVHLGRHFNSVLGNMYRHGRDLIGWHSDDEPELGCSPIIASLSFGATRYFDLRSVAEPRRKHRLELKSGSLLLMSGETQRNWQHSVPKQTTISNPRINLTFRNICT